MSSSNSSYPVNSSGSPSRLSNVGGSGSTYESTNSGNSSGRVYSAEIPGLSDPRMPRPSSPTSSSASVAAAAPIPIAASILNPLLCPWKEANELLKKNLNVIEDDARQEFIELLTEAPVVEEHIDARIKDKDSDELYKIMQDISTILVNLTHRELPKAIERFTKDALRETFLKYLTTSKNISKPYVAPTPHHFQNPNPFVNIQPPPPPPPPSAPVAMESLPRVTLKDPHAGLPPPPPPPPHIRTNSSLPMSFGPAPRPSAPFPSDHRDGSDYDSDCDDKDMYPALWDDALQYLEKTFDSTEKRKTVAEYIDIVKQILSCGEKEVQIDELTNFFVWAEDRASQLSDEMYSFILEYKNRG